MQDMFFAINRTKNSYDNNPSNNTSSNTDNTSPPEGEIDSSGSNIDSPPAEMIQ